MHVQQEQRADVDAVGVRVGEQQHALVAQRAQRAALAGLQPERLRERAQERVGGDARGRGAVARERHALQRQHRLAQRIAHGVHRGRGARAFDDEQLGAGVGTVKHAVGESGGSRPAMHRRSPGAMD